MTDPHATLNASWRAVVDELLILSEQPDSDVPTFTHTQRLYLQLLQPIMMMDGYTLLATQDDRAKNIIETELAPHISKALARHLGRPCSLAITLATPPEPEEAQEFPEPQPELSEPGFQSAHKPVDTRSNLPQAPGQTAVPSQGPASMPPATDYSAGYNNDAYNNDSFRSDNFRAPSSNQGGGFSQDKNWQANHLPASLDELAEFHQHNLSQDSSGQAYSGNRIPRERPAHDPNRDQSLNPKHTFDSFVIGSSNRFANGAAVAVAENPARAYNPLFIWGGSGLGKTHLLHAAGNYAQYLHKGLRVKYVSSEEFTNDYINSLRDDRQESFKRRYRNLDILMVDDIQFLEGKESTQEEFFHTFNALHQANKQIILSSDRPPKQLTTLEDRLRTRFEGGLITDIQPPDLETRIAILMKKAAADGTTIDRGVLELIASRFESSIRELEGALIRVSAYSSLVNEPINMEMAEIALRDLAPDSAAADITAQAIMEVTAEFFSIDVATLTGAGKKRAVAHARQLAMYLCRELTELSLPKIGDEFGGKDHSTVIYADRKIRKEMTENRNTYDEIQALTQRIKNRGKK